MQAVSLKMRILLFLYSTPNLVGCVLAIAGLGLFFGGVIADWWLPIVAGLYAIGWVAMPADKDIELQVRNEMTQDNLVESVEELMRQSKHRLPGEAIERLAKIRDVVVALAPKLFSGDVPMTYAITLINAVTRDLPQTVKNYLHLPTAFATVHSVENGLTCKQLLLGQLDLLSAQLSKIAENIYKDDADALVANGKFLQEKFHTVSFVA
jgi:hypothetical protein